MTVNKNERNLVARIVYVAAIVIAALPFKELFGIEDFVTPAVALFCYDISGFTFSEIQQERFEISFAGIGCRTRLRHECNHGA